MNKRKKIMAINSLLFALLFGLITLNKEFVRPAIIGDIGFLSILTGCFPNFIAAYIISLSTVSAVIIRELKHARFIVYSTAIVVALVLIIEEIKPMWGASEYYDLYDIVASIIGATFSILTFEIISIRQERRK